MVNIDDFVDYRAEYQSIIKQAKISGSQLSGLCPFHDDRKSSFSADLKTGRWHCFAENESGNFLDFYAKLHGISTKEAYRKILEKYGCDEKVSGSAGLTGKDYSLAQYAAEKQLPKEWLEKNCHLTSAKDRDGTSYLKIPYFSEDGTEATYRKRYAEKNFRWKYGSGGKICLYGEWKLQKIRRMGCVVLVEGESDAQSLWYMGIKALGVPGAAMFRASMAEKLKGLKIYIHREPDKGGEIFLEKVTKLLRECGLKGELYQFSCSAIEGLKDPSDLYRRFGRKEGGKKILELLEKAEAVDTSLPEEMPESLKDAPIDLRQPPGWLISDDGISRISERDGSGRLVCRTPILLTRRLCNIASGEEKIEIAFRRDKAWHKAVFPRSTIFTARGITVLSDLGCTVTSENAKELVLYLSALEAENLELIGKTDTASAFGWQSGGRFIPGAGDGIVLDVDPNQRTLKDAYCRAGSLDAWIGTMRKPRDNERFRFILAAGFAAPLMRIIRQRIFFVYNWGASRSGKTAALKAALSVWGDPERLMVNFNATQVGLERTAAFFCDLPLGIDERQLAGRNQEALEKIIYMISSGTGKIRGAKTGGIQAMSNWRTIALATGEEPIFTETSQTGVSTRTLEICGAPFGDEKSAGEMHRAASENYGRAGPAFIKKLIGISEQSIAEKYEEISAALNLAVPGASGSHIAGAAAVALADAMADSWLFNTEPDIGETGILKINPQSQKRAEQMAETILKEQLAADAGDVNVNAVQYLADWVTSNRSCFGESAMGKCYGMMSSEGDTAYILPSILNRALEEGGFSPRKTIGYMADEGLIAVSDRKDRKGRRTTVQKRFDGRVSRFVEFYVGKALDQDGGFRKVAEGESVPFDVTSVTPENAEG